MSSHDTMRKLEQVNQIAQNNFLKSTKDQKHVTVRRSGDVFFFKVWHKDIFHTK